MKFGSRWFRRLQVARVINAIINACPETSVGITDVTSKFLGTNPFNEPWELDRRRIRRSRRNGRHRRDAEIACTASRGRSTFAFLVSATESIVEWRPSCLIRRVIVGRRTLGYNGSRGLRGFVTIDAESLRVVTRGLNVCLGLWWYLLNYSQLVVM